MTWPALLQTAAAAWQPRLPPLRQTLEGRQTLGGRQTLEGGAYYAFDARAHHAKLTSADEPSGPMAPLARPNVRALAATLTLSSVWTVTQIVGALISQSSSLLSDALAMTVDDGAYALNLVAELRPEPGPWPVVQVPTS